MSRHDYLQSRVLDAERPTFATLIMAAMRKADSENILKLQRAFPAIATEFQYRYWSGGGFMPGEEGYNPELDDNLRRAPDVHLKCNGPLGHMCGEES